MNLRDYIRHVQDFPKVGIGFKDITTLLKDADAFRHSIQQIVNQYNDRQIEQVVGVEARGFLFASVVAYELHAGVIPVRKPGKLPSETLREEYALEYGTDAVEMHKDAISPGQKVLVVDDLLATGGTIAATCSIIKKAGGEIVGVAFLIELDFLYGREKLKEYPVYSIVHFAEE